jgi:hypothetical protein
MTASATVASRGARARHRPSNMTACVRWMTAGTFLFALGACADAPEAESGEEGESAEMPDVTRPGVQITGPEEGATVGSSVMITLEVSGFTLAPAGTMEVGTGHHHLVVDADLPTVGMPIPSTDGEYIHMGQAQTELELTGLAAGEHTVIAVVGDGAHMPLMPTVADTVRFVVN